MLQLEENTRRNNQCLTDFSFVARLVHAFRTPASLPFSLLLKATKPGGSIYKAGELEGLIQVEGLNWNQKLNLFPGRRIDSILSTWVNPSEGLIESETRRELTESIPARRIDKI